MLESMRKLAIMLTLAGWAAVAADTGPAAAASLDALGRSEFAAGRYLNARKYFERALQSPATDAANRTVALSNAGQACLALGENRQAEKYFRDAIALAPEVAGLWHRLGQSLFQQHRHAEAESAYRKALQFKPDEADVWADLAAILAAQKRRPEALALLRQAVAATPTGQNRARILRNLAVLEWKDGARHDAAAHLSEALTEMEAAVGQSHPDLVRVLEDYSEALAGIGDRFRSREAARRAQSIRSGFAAQNGTGTVGWRDLRK
jgi:Flp pilus assembly protein TadD